MLGNLQRFSLIRPVKLRLERPIAGPYALVLRRPAPEIAVLGQGQCLVLLRARRLGNPLPLCPALSSPYYAQGHRLKSSDFSDPEPADQLMAEAGAPQVSFLVVPAGHVELPNQPWVSELIARLSPWRAEVVERWRQQLRQENLWLNVVRVYAGTPVSVKLPPSNLPQARIKPIRLAQLRPVLDDREFAVRVEQLLQVVVECAEGGKPRRESVVQMPPENLSQTGYEPAQLAQWEARLRRKKQVILAVHPARARPSWPAIWRNASRQRGGAGIWCSSIPPSRTRTSSRACAPFPRGDLRWFRVGSWSFANRRPSATPTPALWSSTKSTGPIWRRYCVR